MNLSSINKFEKEKKLMLERILRGMAGFFVLLSVALAYFVSIKWLIFTAFVGLNLFQLSFTNWCPAIMMLKKIGIK